MGLIRASSYQFKERRKLCRRPELRNWIEIFECACERIGETPSRSRSEFLELRIEIELVDAPGQVLGSVQLALDEGSIDNQLRGFIRNPGRLPSLDLLSHQLEIPLNPVDPDGKHVDEAEVFGVLRQHRSERPRDNVAKLQCTVDCLGNTKPMAKAM